MNEKLTIALRRIIREEIRTELQMFKQEILKEFRSNVKPQIQESRIEYSSVRSHPQAKPSIKNNPPQFKKKPNQSKQFTKDPLLNSLLSITEPIREDQQIFGGEFDTDYDDLEFLVEEEQPAVQLPPARRKAQPIVQAGPEGQPVDMSKPEVQGVLNVMNMNFSDKLKAMESSAKNLRQGFNGV